MLIVGSSFKGSNKYGDFLWMINQSEFNDSLFIYNDNEEMHNMFYLNGAGNAVIRKYNKHNVNLNKPRSAGIPTGCMRMTNTTNKMYYKGYKVLDDHVKSVIDNSIIEIKELISKYKYDRVFFSCNENNKLSTNLFVVSDDVITYITDQIYSIKNI